MSDKDVLMLVGKLVSRATTLMFCTFPDSDRNIMKNAEQANRRTSQSIPDGMGAAPDDFDVPPSGIDVPPSGIMSAENPTKILSFHHPGRRKECPVRDEQSPRPG